ncbi:MAG: hypothetical protein FWG67_00275 [Defluviitaleaceae bacterium]|nr:hypothetical protein [Defluviitaleaceae bacterium]
MSKKKEIITKMAAFLVIMPMLYTPGSVLFIGEPKLPQKLLKEDDRI